MNKILLFIPCYNCEKQILRVLNSLNNQVFNIVDEIVLVDNRSEDNTRDVIIEFIKKNEKKNFFKFKSSVIYNNIYIKYPTNYSRT